MMFSFNSHVRSVADATVAVRGDSSLPSSVKILAIEYLERLHPEGEHSILVRIDGREDARSMNCNISVRQSAPLA